MGDCARHILRCESPCHDAWDTGITHRPGHVPVEGDTSATFLAFDLHVKVYVKVKVKVNGNGNRSNGSNSSNSR